MSITVFLADDQPWSGRAQLRDRPTSVARPQATRQVAVASVLLRLQDCHGRLFPLN